MHHSLKTKISTPKYQKTRAFYESIFGMTVAEEWDSPDDVGAILAFAHGRDEAYLEIYLTDQVHNFDGLSLQFKVESLDTFVASLPPDIAYEGPTPRPWGSTYLYLRDPNDIQVIVYEGGL